MGILGPLAGRWFRARARSAVRAGLAIAALGWAANVSAQTAAPREVKLEIAAGVDWTSTGIEVEPGDAIAVEAEPAQVPGGLAVPPDGVSQPGVLVMNVMLEGRPAPDLPHAALIGRIGGGPAFLVGRHYRTKVTDSGPLELRWNIPTGSWHGETAFYPAVVRHERAIVISDDDLDNKLATNEIATEGNVIVENRSVETVAAPSRPRPKETRPTPVAEPPSIRAWLLPGLALLLLAAVAAGLTFRRVSRARSVKRTRAMLGVSPSLDLAEGRCGVDDLPAEGPAASLRARLDPGGARMEEGKDHG